MSPKVPLCLEARFCQIQSFVYKLIFHEAMHVVMPIIMLNYLQEENRPVIDWLIKRLIGSLITGIDS